MSLATQTEVAPAPERPTPPQAVRGGLVFAIKLGLWSIAPEQQRLEELLGVQKHHLAGEQAWRMEESTVNRVFRLKTLRNSII